MHQVVQDIIGRLVTDEGSTIGQIADLLFDDRTWAVRYLVASNPGLRSPRLLVARQDVQFEDEGNAHLTGSRRAGLQPEDADLPVSAWARRRREYFVRCSHMSVACSPAGLPALPMHLLISVPPPEQPHDPYLRSALAIKDHRVMSRDGCAGATDDLVVDDDSRRVLDLVLRDGPPWHHERRLVPTYWVTRLDAERRVTSVDLDASHVASLARLTD